VQMCKVRSDVIEVMCCMIPFVSVILHFCTCYLGGGVGAGMCEVR